MLSFLCVRSLFARSLLLLLVGITLLPAPPATPGLADGTTCIIDSSGNPGTFTSLLAAVAQSSCSLVLVSAGTFEGGGSIARDLTVRGIDRQQSILDTGGSITMFNVQAGVTMTVTNLTLRNGVGNATGGIINEGTLTLSSTLITGSEAASGGETRGGGIYNSGQLVVSDSIIRGNRAQRGGGIYNEGTLLLQRSSVDGNLGRYPATATTGIETSGPATLIDVAIYNHDGVGLLVSSPSPTPTVQLTNVTLSGNSTANISTTAGLSLNHVTMQSPASAAESFRNLFAASTVEVSNTIFSGGGRPNCALAGGSIVSRGGNIDSGNACGLNAAGDRRNTDPRLLVLRDNGGPSWTHALPADSPAVDAAVPAACPQTDQRGTLRPAGGACDVGAFEYQAGPQLTRLTPATVPSGYPDFTLRVEGSGFLDGALVRWNDFPQPTTFVSSTLLLVAVDTPNLAFVGRYPISVANPGAAPTDPLSLTVVAAQPRPPFLPIGALGGAAGTAPVSGTLAFLAEGSQLSILDISNPALPQRVGSYQTNDVVMDVELAGNLAYLAVELGGLLILDVSNPAAPRRIGGFDTPAAAVDVLVANNRAYIGDSYGLLILVFLIG